MPLSPSEYRRQTTTHRPLLFWSICVLISATFCALILAAPLAAAAGDNRLAFAIYQPLGLFCHQLPERSFFIAGHKLAVCARCTGIYAGFLLTLLLYPLVRAIKTTSAPPRKWLFIGAVPMAIDFSLGFFGIWANTHSSRFLTGFLLGATAVFYVMPGIAELSLRGVSRNKTGFSRQTSTLHSPEALAAAPSDYSAPDRRI